MLLYLLVIFPKCWIFTTTGPQTPTLPHGAMSQLLSITHSIPRLVLWLHLHQWSPQILILPRLSWSPWPLHAFESSSTWGTLTYYQVQLPAGDTALVSPWPQILCTEETFLRKFHISDAGWSQSLPISQLQPISVNYYSKAKILL